MRNLTVAALLFGLLVGDSLLAAEEVDIPPKHDWTFNGPLGTFDRAQLQRGLQVYKEVCATCHSLKLLSYRNLEALGFNEEEIKAYASQYDVHDGPNEEGEMFERPAIPSDHFVGPYKNDQAARAANNGAFPPDLSVITKARVHGADYVYSLLTGYEEPPTNVQLGEGLHYNRYFPGNQIAMVAPLTDGLVQFSDGTNATVHQMAEDVTAFLSWASEPESEKRKQLGVMAIIYLLAFSLVMFWANRRVWARLQH